MRVDLDELEKTFARLDSINRLPLEEITWERDGKEIKPSHEEIMQWEFIGLNNTEFPMFYGLIKRA